MDQAGMTASPQRRVIFLVVAALMLLLWGLSLIPPIENWNNPYEDGFSYVGVVYASNHLPATKPPPDVVHRAYTCDQQKRQFTAPQN